jgi:hypothetical protein
MKENGMGTYKQACSLLKMTQQEKETERKRIVRKPANKKVEN